MVFAIAERDLDSLVSLCFLDGAQIRALQVLDECQLEDLVIADLTYQNRHLAETCKLGGLIASLARHNLVARTLSPYQDGLQDAVLPD